MKKLLSIAFFCLCLACQFAASAHIAPIANLEQIDIKVSASGIDSF